MAANHVILTRGCQGRTAPTLLCRVVDAQGWAIPRGRGGP